MSNIRGLSDFTNSNKGKGNDSDSDDDDKPQQFFAGGEKSGVAIQGPPKGKNLVKDIMGKAANADSQETQQTPSYFSGSGHRLGTENDEPSLSSSPVATQQPQQQTQRQELHEPVERRLTFWQDGFTVEFGALMRYDDPANEALLQAINNGTAPLSLLNVLPGQQVTVNIEEHLSEPWTKEAADNEVPAEIASALPGGFPSSSSSSSSSAAPAPAVSAAAISVDPNAPTTSIQIRLADGTRLVARMNHTHTVGDLRSFVQASKPGQGAFAIMTTFPNRDLTEDGVSLKEAGLLNAVVVQRML
ncbi:SEP-domain-containing protein [Chytriomyces cf. hyalinus JEL632]|nr:SEP-domain-containing protein [Chytriomyces cf. hyalinus JEL632]